MGLPDSHEPCEAEIALQLVAEEEFRMLPPGVDSLLVASRWKGPWSTGLRALGGRRGGPTASSNQAGPSVLHLQEAGPVSAQEGLPPDDSQGLRQRAGPLGAPVSLSQTGLTLFSLPPWTLEAHREEEEEGLARRLAPSGGAGSPSQGP